MARKTLKKVYDTLKENSEDNRCKLKNLELASIVNLHERQLRWHLKHLKEKRYIKSEFINNNSNTRTIIILKNEFNENDFKKMKKEND